MTTKFRALALAAIAALAIGGAVASEACAQGRNCTCQRVGNFTYCNCY